MQNTKNFWGNLAVRFGLKGVEPNAYFDSYHGLAMKRGDLSVALCTDCHAVHKILPKENSASSISVQNVKHTCSRCHEEATETFAKSYSHQNSNIGSSKTENTVKIIYF